MLIKKNFPLYLGLAIPLFMVIFIAISVYLPYLYTAKPQKDFLYCLDDYYGLKFGYDVTNSKIRKIERTNSDNFPNRSLETPKLYYHDTKKNMSREISFEAAEQLVLNGNTFSSDGFEIVNGSSDSWLFPFFYGNYDYRSRYIKKKGYSQKLNLNLGIYSNHYYNFYFLGWVE